MRAAVATVLVLSACGRVGFSSLGDGGLDPNTDGLPDADLRPRHELVDQFLPSNTPGTGYGSSVAISGNGSRVVVGVPGANGGAGNAAVWRFDGEALGWSLEGVLSSDTPHPADFFGSSIAISDAGDRIVVGAYQEDGPQNRTDGGAFYVFDRAATTWSLSAHLAPTIWEAFDYVGSGVAISADGSTIAVGAPAEDSAATGLDGDPMDNSVGESGAAYLFERSGATWVQTHYVKPPATSPDQFFGTSVALSSDGRVLAVGASHEESLSGAAYVIEPALMSTTRLLASNPSAGVYFGWSVALSANGKRLMVGSPNEGGGGRGINQPPLGMATDSGAAYIFDNTTSWSQVAYVKALNSDINDGLGICVSLSADGAHAIVGASGEAGDAIGRDGPDSNAASGAGAVYELLRGSDGAWTQKSYIKALDTAAGDRFGSSCAISGDSFGIAVGAPQRNSGSGGTYVYLQVLD